MCIQWPYHLVVSGYYHCPYWAATAGLRGSLILPFRVTSPLRLPSLRLLQLGIVFEFDSIFWVTWVIATICFIKGFPCSTDNLDYFTTNIVPPSSIFGYMTFYHRPIDMTDIHLWRHKYASRATYFEDFLIAHCHLTESSLAKTDPDYDTWNQLHSVILS